jgi:hypothetical protein
LKHFALAGEDGEVAIFLSRQIAFGQREVNGKMSSVLIIHK